MHAEIPTSTPYNEFFRNLFLRHYGEISDKNIRHFHNETGIKEDIIRGLLDKTVLCCTTYDAIIIRKYFNTSYRTINYNWWSMKNYRNLEIYRRSNFGEWVYRFMRKHYIPVFEAGNCPRRYIWELLRGERKVIPAGCSKDFINFLQKGCDNQVEVVKELLKEESVEPEMIESLIRRVGAENFQRNIPLE